MHVIVTQLLSKAGRYGLLIHHAVVRDGYRPILHSGRLHIVRDVSVHDRVGAGPPATLLLQLNAPVGRAFLVDSVHELLLFESIAASLVGCVELLALGRLTTAAHDCRIVIVVEREMNLLNTTDAGSSDAF